MSSLQMGLILNYIDFATAYDALFRQPFGSIFYVLTISLAWFEFLMGLGFLRFKEWARRSVLIIAVIYIAMAAAMVLTARRNYCDYWTISWQEFKKNLSEERALLSRSCLQSSFSKNKILNQRERQKVRSYLWQRFLGKIMPFVLSMFILLGKFFLWYPIAILSLARSKIREQFSF